MFNLFKKKTFSKKYLRKKSAVRHKKEWEKLLQSLGSVASQKAERGEMVFIFAWSAVKIPHNEKRTHKDILTDVKRKFKGCEIAFDTDLNGQALCHISWVNS